MTDLRPSPRHRFTFGLPTNVYGPEGVPGDGGFRPIEPWDFVQGLADIGAWGIAIRDDELVPPTATAQDRESRLGKVRAALDGSGVVVSMVAADFARYPMFRDGAFTSADGDIRRCAIRKAMRAIDLGAEIGAASHVFSSTREAVTTAAAAKPTDALDRYREAINFLCEYVRDRAYPVRFALLPGSPHRDALLPTVGHVLSFIETLDHPDMVGVSPRPTSDSAACHTLHRDVAHAIWSGKLAHVELNAAQIDLDRGFGSAGLKDAFVLVKILEEAGFDGPRHFGARPCHGEDLQGVWDFAAGCVRTYLALAAKARRFAVDPDIQEAMADAGAFELAEPTTEPYSADVADKLAVETSDPDAVLERGSHQRRLDQLITDLLLGLR